MPRFLEALSDNPYLTNCWLLAREGSDEALVIDPGFFADPIHGRLRAAGLRAVAALATHGHGDHVGQSHPRSFVLARGVRSPVKP